MSANSSIFGSEPSWRRYVATLFAVPFVLIALTSALNVVVDPLWFFAWGGRLNRVQTTFNERQQKSDLLAQRRSVYDGLLLGSSRTTYIDPNDVPGIKTFNFAVASMMPEEYASYVEFAQAMNGQPFRSLIIGVDFFGTNASFRRRHEPDEEIFRNASSLWFRLRSLTNIGLAVRSIKNGLASLGFFPFFVRSGFDREYYDVAYTHRLMTWTDEERRQRVAEDLLVYAGEEYGNYVYDQHYRERLQHLKLDGVRIVVFTTPESAALFKLIGELGLQPDYERWLSDLVDQFGEIYDFSGVNSVTTNLGNYVGAHHFTPAIGALIMRKAVGRDERADPPDFGVRITRENLGDHLIDLRRQQAWLASAYGSCASRLRGGADGACETLNTLH